MATAIRKQAGDRIDHTPSGAIAAGDVVLQGDLIGIAESDIAASAKGSLAVRGVFTLPKEDGSSVSFTAGQKVYWNPSTLLVESSSGGSNKYLGKVVAAAGATDATVDVLLEQ